MPRGDAQPDMFAGMEAVVPPSPTVLEAQEIWNTYAEKNKWKKCVVLDKARKATIARAVGDYGGILGWRQALEKVERNRFVMGKVPPREGTRFKQFQAHIDWFCQAKTIRQVFEGFYEDDGGQDGIEQPGSSFRSKMKALVDWDARLNRYRKGGFWHVPTEGPRPEDAGPHKAPAEKIEAWRKKHGIVERKQETREERLAASIATFRRLGDYARANGAEEQLAALQGRPPVLVPAPEARDPDVVPPARARPAPYRPKPRPSEAEITRRMAEVEDIPYDEIPEGDPDMVDA